MTFTELSRGKAGYPRHGRRQPKQAGHTPTDLSRTFSYCVPGDRPGCTTQGYAAWSSRAPSKWGMPIFWLGQVRFTSVAHLNARRWPR
jgi:hypothetical protein